MPGHLIADGRPFRGSDPAHGFSRQQLRTLVANSVVHPVFRGVFLDRRVPLTPTVRAQCAALTLAPGVVLARGTAAWVHGIAPVEPGAHRSLPRIEALAPIDRSSPRRAGHDGHSGRLGDDDWVEIGGVPVTTPLRTALDLARWRERPDALAYVDAITHRGLVSHDGMVAALPGLNGLPWVEQAREIVDLCEPLTESAGESWMRLRQVDAGFPRPRVQVWLYDDDGTPLFRLDSAVVKLLVASEYDGEEAHDEEQAAADLARRRWIEERGYTLLSFRREHVLGKSYAFERALGEAFSMQPRLLKWEQRRRTYAGRPWPSRPTTPA